MLRMTLLQFQASVLAVTIVEHTRSEFIRSPVGAVDHAIQWLCWTRPFAFGILQRYPDALRVFQLLAVFLFKLSHQAFVGLVQLVICSCKLS